MWIFLVKQQDNSVYRRYGYGSGKYEEVIIVFSLSKTKPNTKTISICMDSNFMLSLFVELYKNYNHENKSSFSMTFLEETVVETFVSEVKQLSFK